MSELLSAADRSSIFAEQGAVNMAVGGLLLLDGGPGVSRAALIERVAERIHLVPRLRQRLGRQAPGIPHIGWVDDDAFDLDWHVRELHVDEPAGDAQLAELVGREMSRRLDRSRPLWELTIVGGLRGGRAALLAKLHHALADGVAALAIAGMLLDPTPEPLRISPPDEPWAPRAATLRDHLSRMAAAQIMRTQQLVIEGAARAAADADPRRAARELRRATAVLGELARARPQAPMTPLNEPLSPYRGYATARAPLDAIKAAAHRHHGTVNDVLLAAVAGMLARYLYGGRHEPPAADPVALVPISVRGASEQGLGNRISTAFVDLPVREPDLAGRVRAIADQTRRIKDSAAVRAGALVLDATGWAPPLVSSMLARLMGGVLAFNLVASNVPGPQQPFYLNGCRLRDVYPIVPLNPANQRLSVGIVSYDGDVCFGLLADRELDPPLQAARAALAAALAEFTPS